jgi:hypothetical protein
VRIVLAAALVALAPPVFVAARRFAALACRVDAWPEPHEDDELRVLLYRTANVVEGLVRAGAQDRHGVGRAGLIVQDPDCGTCTAARRYAATHGMSTVTVAELSALVDGPVALQIPALVEFDDATSSVRVHEGWDHCLSVLEPA